MQLQDIKVLEFDLSSKCNAACPQCARSQNNFTNISNNNEVTLGLIKKWIPLKVLNNLEIVSFKGTFSEPVLANEFLDIVQFFVDHSKAKLLMHTNGSLRKPEWWADLAARTLNRAQVFFAIDGLEDTHHLYRINTSYNKIIENAKAFIDAGGNARWQFIKFKHNQHQIKAAEQLAIQLGFRKFLVIDNDRFLENSAVKTNKGNYLEKSQLDTAATHEEFRKQIKQNLKGVACQSKLTGWVTIDWDGDVFPCCYSQVWKSNFSNYSVDDLIWKKARDNKSNNLNDNSLDAILKMFASLYSLHDRKAIPVVCAKHCSIN